MAKRDVSEAVDRTVKYLDDLMAEMPPTDLMVMMLGAVAGYNGYTPMSAVINVGSGLGDINKGLKEKADKGDVIAGYAYGATNSPFGVLGGASPLITFIYGSLGAAQAAQAGTTPETVNLPVDQRKELAQAIMAKAALAAIGAIEAYAITRPGTIAGIGEIVKGIGEIVPG